MKNVGIIVEFLLSLNKDINKFNMDNLADQDHTVIQQYCLFMARHRGVKLAAKRKGIAKFLRISSCDDGVRRVPL